MVSIRSLLVALMLSQQSYAAAQQMLPVMVDSVWQLGSDKIRHQVKALQTETNPPVKSAVAPAGVFRCVWTKPLVLPITGFKSGDTLEITCSINENHSFKSVGILNDGNQQLAGVINTPETTLRVVITDEKSLKLKLQTRPARKKQFATVSVLRITPVPSDSFYFVQDTIFSLTQTIVRDTLIVSVLDDTLTLAPLWNIESRPAAFKKCQIPVSAEPNARLSHVSYWIGIGQDCLARYSTLEKTMPPAKNGPGVSPPICALTAGQFIALPTTQRHEVEWEFTTEREKREADKSRKPGSTVFAECRQLQSCTLGFSRSGKAMLGTSTVPVSKEQLGVTVHFKNRNTVVGYPVRIILAGCFIRETPGAITRSVIQVKSYKEKTGR